ncbi:hypothetical protein GCM10027440_25450 [Nocardiopsis coralliicola]
MPIAPMRASRRPIGFVVLIGFSSSGGIGEWGGASRADRAPETGPVRAGSTWRRGCPPAALIHGPADRRIPERSAPGGPGAYLTAQSPRFLGT